MSLRERVRVMLAAKGVAVSEGRSAIAFTCGSDVCFTRALIASFLISILNTTLLFLQVWLEHSL